MVNKLSQFFITSGCPIHWTNAVSGLKSIVVRHFNPNILKVELSAEIVTYVQKRSELLIFHSVNRLKSAYVG